MKPSQILCRRVRYFKLTTKQASHDYYKGNRTGSMGTHTKHGGYIIDYKKVRSYVCPDLKGFDLTPFVTKRIDPYADRALLNGKAPEKKRNHPQSGYRYLNKWKEVNGED